MKKCEFCKKKKPNIYPVSSPGQDTTIGYICSECYERNMEQQTEIEDIGKKLGYIETDISDIEKKLIKKFQKLGPVKTGKILDISYQQVQSYMAGKRSMKIETLIEYAKKLLL